MLAPEPRFMTPIDEHAPHEGDQIAAIANVLKKPLMPWQRLVARGGTQLKPNGGYRYQTVLVTVPRQSGKTTLVGPVQLHRIMTRERIKCFFAAQTGLAGRARFNDLVELVAGSPLAPFFAVRRSAGNERLSTPRGSSINVFARPERLHGETPHLVTLDEIWKHNDAEGQNYMGAIGPAQQTLNDSAQLWLISTRGTHESGFMNQLVERGRAGDPDMFYAEWSMPDDADPYDPHTWVFHPALGNTITLDALEKEARRQPPGEWMRAYMNRLTETSDPLIAAADFAALAQLPLAVPSRRALSIAYAVSPDNELSTVTANWRDTDGAPCTRVVHTAPGSTWLVPFLIDLATEWQPAHLAADDGGPTRRVTDELRRAHEAGALHVEPFTTGPRDFATACEAWMDYVTESRSLKHDGSATLSTGVANLAMRSMGDARVFSRTRSTGPIVGPESSAVGLWAADHADQPMPDPIIRF